MANMGLALAAQGEREDAVEWLRRAVASGPGVVLARNNLGLLLRMGRFAEAETVLRGAIEISPRRPCT